MATKKYLDYAGLKRVLAKLLPGARKIWHGTLAEWEALSATEKAKYDQAEVIDEYTGVPVVVDKVESGNLNPVTSNAVAEALETAAIGQAKIGYFPVISTKGNHNSSMVLTEGTWRVELSCLCSNVRLSGDVGISINGAAFGDRRFRYEPNGSLSEVQQSVSVIVTVPAGGQYTTGMMIYDSPAISINGDLRFWNMQAIRVA